MKRSTFLFCSLLLPASGLLVSSGWSAESAEADTGIVPAIEQLEGIVVTRPEGNLLQINVENHRVVLRFLNQEGEPEPADVDSGTIRVIPAGRSPTMLPIVPSEDRLMMTHGRTINPPFNFNLHINLFREGQEDSVERYVVSYP